jgi:hypothetical protein
MASDEAGSWLVDPTRRHQYRWWDGSGWTDQVSDHGVRSNDPYENGRGTVPPPGATHRTTSTSSGTGTNPYGVVALIGGAVALMGVGVNEISANVGAIQVTRTYFDSDSGKVVAAIAALGIVIALFGLLRPSPGWLVQVLVFVCGATIAGFALYDRLNISDDVHRLRVSVNGSVFVGSVTTRVGVGLYLCMGGGVLMAVCALMAGRDV